jgi:predicted permease
VSAVDIMTHLTADLGQSWRWIRRHGALSLTVVATLTVAFAAVLAALSVLNDVVLRPLPFPSPERIMEVRVTGPTVARGIRASSRPNFEDWRERTRSFDALAAYGYPEAPLRLTGRGEPRELDAVRVTIDWPRVFGLTAASGRLFTERDFGNGAAPVVVLTHAFWRSEFGADPAAVGRTLTLNGRAHEIVGVLPDTDLSYPVDAHAIWLPLIPAPGAFWEHARETGWLFVVGRLRDGVSQAEAEAELTSVARALAVEHPKSNRDRTDAELTPVSDALLGPIAPVLVMIAIALGAVLLIACGNIVNLLLASAAARAREFAVRAAIGAARTRLVGQIASEALILCGVAGGAAIGLSPALARAFISLYPTALPRRVDTGIDAWTIGAGLALAALGTLLLAVPQAVRAVRVDVYRAIAASARATESRADRVIRTALVTVQIALSFVLIAAGAAFVRTFDRLARVDPGYRAKDVMTFTVTPSPASGSGAAALQFYESVIDGIRQLPGVRNAAAAVAAPMATGGWSFGLRPHGASADVLVGVNLTTAEYFEALAIPLRAGRLFTAAEQRTGNAVALVNEPLAKLLDDRVVGRGFDYTGRRWEIVGVVGGIRQRGVRQEPAPELFIPWHMAGGRPQTVIVRADGDPLRLVPAITARVHVIDPTAPVSNVARMEDRLNDAIVGERFRATLLASLAGIAVALAGLGAYSVTAYSVARRTREYGIRLALGEPPASIGRRALAAAVGPAIAGVAAGAVIVIAAGQWIESFLYGVSGRDAMTIVSTAVALVSLAAVAAAMSARRAANLSPAATLSEE